MPANSDNPNPQELLLDFTNFWKKVDKDGPIHPTKPELGNCWLWIGKIRPNGYGMAWNGATQKEMRAHRAAYFLTYGPTDLQLNHSCDRPACVNPSHLFADTQKANLDDMRAKGRGFQKLTTKEAIEILNLRASGMILKSIHERFESKVSFSAICHICYRREWKHLNVEVAPSVSDGATT